MIDGMAFIKGPVWADRNYWICTACKREIDDTGGPPKCPCREPFFVHEFKEGDLYCRCHGLTREELGAPATVTAWIPTPPPDVEPPVEEPTPIPQRKRRNCYQCGAPDACARRADEPAYCEEHRKK